MIKDSWARLEDAPLYGTMLRARIAVPEASNRLLAAIDSAGTRHFLIAISHGEESLTDLRGRSVRVETRELLTPDRGLLSYIDVSCLEASGHSAFDAFGEDLLLALAIGASTTADIVARTIDKWRHLWLLGSDRSLKREVEIGLFGELWFLLFWLAPKLGTQRAIALWRGPDSARHDFEASSFSVEAKTTLVQRGLTHEIAGLEQLLPPEGGPLYLYSMKAREEQGARNNIRVLLALLANQASAEGVSLAGFDAKLGRLGLRRDDPTPSAPLPLRVQAEGLYHVAEDFPALTTKNVLSPLPASIESVRYTLNLTACEKYKLCDAPDSAAWRDLELH